MKIGTSWQIYYDLTRYEKIKEIVRVKLILKLNIKFSL